MAMEAPPVLELPASTAEGTVVEVACGHAEILIGAVTREVTIFWNAPPAAPDHITFEVKAEERFRAIRRPDGWHLEWEPCEVPTS